MSAQWQRMFALVRGLGWAAHLIIAIGTSFLAIGQLNSGFYKGLLSAAVSAILWLPAIPRLARSWRQRSFSIMDDPGQHITRIGALLGTLFAGAGLTLILYAVGALGILSGENRLGAWFGAIAALWLASLTMELSRRQGAG